MRYSADSPVLSTREGRFPTNDILSLLDVNRRFNLAESTAEDLFVSDLLKLADPQELHSIRLGYGSSRGIESLRELISEQTGISRHCVLTTTGTCLALALVAAELCQQDDEVVLTAPYFPPTHDALALGTGSVKSVRLQFENGYRLDLEDIRAALSEQTSLVMLASPQNPSGVATTADEVRQLLGVMSKACPRAYLLIDETYRVASYGSQVPAPSMACLDPRIISVASVSKAHGAPGLRVGWLTCHDHTLLERLTIGKLNTVISGSPLNEYLAATLLKNEDKVLQPRREMLATAIETVEQWVGSHPELIRWVRPTAGALCCIRLHERAFDDNAVQRFWQHLPQTQVQLADGHWFGEDSRVFRLGFGYLSLDELTNALSALTSVLRLFAN